MKKEHLIHPGGEKARKRNALGHESCPPLPNIRAVPGGGKSDLLDVLAHGVWESTGEEKRALCQDTEEGSDDFRPGMGTNQMKRICL